jgi:serine/threonine-protein kinase CHEK2
MAPRQEKSQLKRPRVRLVFSPMFLRTILNRACLTKGSLPENDIDSKKPRRSERLSGLGPDKTPVSHKQHLPTPVTNHLSTEESAELYKESTATPPGNRPSHGPRKPTEDLYSQARTFSSPPQDTQAFSQLQDPQSVLSEEVEDEVKEGVWGYLYPLDTRYGGRCQVLKKRTACPLPDSVHLASPDMNNKGKSPLKDEEAYETTKINSIASGGYLIGRHPECGEYFLLWQACWTVANVYRYRR